MNNITTRSTGTVIFTLRTPQPNEVSNDAAVAVRSGYDWPQFAVIFLTTSDSTFLASPNTIMVLGL